MYIVDTMNENTMNQNGGAGVEHESLVDRVVAHLKSRIIEGAYKPGERLLEVKIASELTVSRAPIREAYRILESECSFGRNADFNRKTEGHFL